MVSRPARIRVQIHIPEGSIGPSCIADPRRACCSAASRRSALASCCRPASLLPPPAPSPSRLTHPTDTTLSAAPATHLPLVPPSTPHLCVASERACVRNGGWGVWRAPQSTSTTLLPPPRQPPLLPGQNRLTCPCQAQNAKTRRRRAARARGAAPAVARPYRHLTDTLLGPSEQPSRRPPTAPVVGLDRVCIPVFLKKARR